MNVRGPRRTPVVPITAPTFAPPSHAAFYRRIAYTFFGLTALILVGILWLSSVEAQVDVHVRRTPIRGESVVEIVPQPSGAVQIAGGVRARRGDGPRDRVPARPAACPAERGDMRHGMAIKQKTSPKFGKCRLNHRGQCCVKWPVYRVNAPRRFGEIYFSAIDILVLRDDLRYRTQPGFCFGGFQQLWQRRCPAKHIRVQFPCAAIHIDIGARVIYR